MPSYFYEIPDVSGTVEKAVTDNVVRNLLESMGLEDADIIYEGDSYQEGSQPNSTVGDKREQSYGSSDRVYVNVEEQRDPTSRIERMPGYSMQSPFFHDTDHDVRLVPSFVKYDVDVTIRRRAPSKSTVQKWCNEIQRRTDMGRDIFPTHADYYYRIPYPALELLKDCYTTKFFDATPPYDLQAYFKRFFTSNVSVVNSVNGSGSQYAVRVSQQRILGILDTEGPKERKGNNTVNWECEFSFKFNYERPEAVEAIFPIILNNTLMERKWWPSNLSPGLMDDSGGRGSSFVQAAEHIIEPQYLKLPVYIPQCDKPQLSIPEGLTCDAQLAIIHLEMAPSDSMPNRLFNINQLGEFKLNDLLLDYIALSYSENPQGTDSIFNAFVFENQALVDSAKVAIDNEGEVYLNRPTFLPRVYRVILALELDWDNLSDAGFDFLRRSPEFVSLIMAAFRPALYNKHLLQPTQPTLPPARLDGLIGDLGQLNEQAHGHYGAYAKVRTPVVVHNNSIIAYRRDL